MSDETQRNWHQEESGVVRLSTDDHFTPMILKPYQNNEIYVRLGLGYAYFNADDLIEAVKAARPEVPNE